MVFFDLLQVIFWSITYVLIIVFGFIKRNYFMPIIAAFLNIAWESNALYKDLSNNIYNSITLAHFVWILLDFFIVLTILFYYIEKDKKVVISFVSLPFLIVGLKIMFDLKLGQLYSCFSIDLIMAICYLVLAIRAKEHINELSIIGITKLLGDFFAFIMYRQYDFINVVGIIVFIINSMYLAILNNKLINVKLSFCKHEI